MPRLLILRRRRRLLAFLLAIVAVILTWLQLARRKRLRAAGSEVEKAATAAAGLEAAKVEAVEQKATGPLLRRGSTRALRPVAEDSEDRFAAFLSHYKIEAATEARWLQGELEALLSRRCFLDSDDLNLLTDLTNQVRSSDCLLLLQTKSVLTRPW